MKLISDENGFTLIEVTIALGVFSIGILAMMIMQTTGIKGNATANTISSASVLAGDRIEQIFGMNYNTGVDLDGDGTSDTLSDTTNDGIGGINNATALTADGNVDTNILNGINDPDGSNFGTVFWNVVEDYPMPKTMTIRVIVNRMERGITRTVSFDYITAEVVDN